MSSVNYKDKYLKYKTKYLQLKAEIQQHEQLLGGVTPGCVDGNLVRFYEEIMRMVKRSYPTLLNHHIGHKHGYPNDCNLWIWNKLYNINYTGASGLINHIDFFYNRTNKYFGVTVKKDNIHKPPEILQYANNYNEANKQTLVESIINVLKKHFP
jgi:hypothetical protein